MKMILAKNLLIHLSILLLMLSPVLLLGQGNVEIEGYLKIKDVQENVLTDSVLVHQVDGKVAVRSIESLDNRSSNSCSMAYHVLPPDFDFQNIPASYARSIWEIRHCHDLMNMTVVIPPEVILSFRGGKLINFQNVTGNLTSIEASNIHIFDGLAIGGTWMIDYVNPCWFGARPSATVDSKAAFDKATAFALGLGIRKMTIPSGRYHLSAPWYIKHSSGNSKMFPIQIEGYGAIFDNTVVVAFQSVSLKGLTVQSAPNHGFVFLRGQGAHHEHLLARECGLDGFYMGIDAGNGDYGFNFQVTRCVFSGLLAVNNGRHGWLMEGNSLANRSWFNANSVISFAAVSNTEKGFTWVPGNGPNGASQLNYSTFINMNCEGNGDISVDLPESRACTFIGGHFVDADTSDYTFRTPGPYNVSFGGRNVGNMESSSFAYLNSATSSGIIGRISGVDNLQTADIQTADLTVAKEPFIPKGWSILPRSLESFVLAPDNKNNHKISFDLSAMSSADDMMLRMTHFGKRNSASANNQKYAYAILVHLTSDTSGDLSLDWNRLSTDQHCTINAVTLSGKILTIDFSTTYIVFGSGVGVTEYQDSSDTDFR